MRGGGTGPDVGITDFEVVLANTTGARIVGRQLPDAFIGRRMSELLPSWEGRESFGQVAGVVETGVSKAWLLPYFSDGIKGWFNMSIIRQDDQAVVTFLDVSDLKQLQEKLEWQNRELQQSNDHLQQFAYIVSHDLQEPLHRIQSFGDILTTDYESTPDETGHDVLRRMRSSAERMSLLVKGMLTYLRLSSRPEPFASVFLSSVMARVLDDLDLTIRDSGGAIAVD